MDSKKSALIRQLIAVVDDDPSMLKGVNRLLQTQGFATEAFGSGEEFLRSGTLERVACVILDINLGGISGIETRRALATKSCSAPVIFMTGLDTAGVRREAINSGCAAYLRKPFSGRELVDAIRSATAVN